MKYLASALVFAALLAPLEAQAASIGMTLTLNDPGQWQHLSYTCDGQDEQMAVDYLNAAPNFLALVPVEGKTLVFASVISASGVRYASGKYEWWTKGAEASLFDLTAGKDALPLLACLEANETP